MERAVGAVCFDRAEWMEQTVEATTEILPFGYAQGRMTNGSGMHGAPSCRILRGFRQRNPSRASFASSELVRSCRWFDDGITTTGDVRADIGWNEHGVAAAGEPGVSAAARSLRRRPTSRAWKSMRRCTGAAWSEPEAFWAEAAGELEWFAPWEKVLDGAMGSHAKWFVGGKLNLSHNCVDRHALGARREKVALLWEGEPGEVRRITLRRAACAGAAVCECAEGAGRASAATGWRSTWGWGRSWRLRCWRARGSARCIR